ncbi:MAG: metal-dependent hydrolase [Deltaproteobacteria bacterium]|nr:metal-dependent hydrolase [Deltaproteobacteria bacterium]
MAGFKTHLAGGIASGTGLSLIGYSVAGLSLMQTGAIFVVGSVAGLLPDLDSDTGKPLTFLFQLVSILVPSLLFTRVTQRFGNAPEFLICYFTLSYLFINYMICGVIKKVTVHRGILHSLPFALLCGGIGYLLFKSSGKDMALLAGSAVLAGCVIHLLLDEINSFELKLGFIPFPKRSRGTALKLVSGSIPATVFVYLLLGLVVAAIFVPGPFSRFA